jgi:hypothetical protein
MLWKKNKKSSENASLDYAAVQVCCVDLYGKNNLNEQIAAVKEKYVPSVADIAAMYGNVPKFSKFSLTRDRENNNLFFICDYVFKPESASSADSRDALWYGSWEYLGFFVQQHYDGTYGFTSKTVFSNPTAALENLVK